MKQSTDTKAVRTPPSEKKSPVMHITLLLGWAFCLIWFNPRFFSLISQATTLSNKIVLALFILCLDIFWLFGTYYLLLFIFALLSERKRKSSPPELAKFPKVAILYVTLNDFQRRAALSCVEQDYPDFHVFILDDSLNPGKKAEVDKFGREFSGRVSIIRRNDRKGFKAGSVNNALRNHVQNYPYFALIDADGVLPKDFLRKLLPHFQLDNKIAFVQGSHRPNPIQKSKFARDLSLGIVPLWTVWYPPRNQYGFVMFLGHGGVLRRDVWARAGGFPEMVCEDLAFSTKIRELEYLGCFVRDVVSFEDFPETYRQLRRQQEKYIKGGCEYLCKGFSSFLKSKDPKWFEKLDLTISLGSLFLPVVYLFFMFIFLFALPNFLSETKVLSLSVMGIEIGKWKWFSFTDQFNSVWTWDFYLVVLINTFSPVLGCLKTLFRHPIRTIRLLFLLAVPYLSLMLLMLFSVASYLVTKQRTFMSTGDKSPDKAILEALPGGKAQKSISYALGPESRIVLAAELGLGITLTIFSLKIVNVTFLAFALSLILGFFLFRYGWENKILRPFLFLPFTLIVFGIAFVGLSLLGVAGMFFVFFAFHF